MSEAGYVWEESTMEPTMVWSQAWWTVDHSAHNPFDERKSTSFDMRKFVLFDKRSRYGQQVAGGDIVTI